MQSGYYARLEGPEDLEMAGRWELPISMTQPGLSSKRILLRCHREHVEDEEIGDAGSEVGQAGLALL